MPTKTRTPCQVPGCPTLITTPGRCPAHATAYDRRKKRSSPWRNYGATWKRARELKLTTHPTCTCQLTHPKCCNQTAPATEVHHLQRLRDGGTHDQTNLQALCKPCHGAHTLHELANDRQGEG